MDNFKDLEKFIKEYQDKSFEKRLKERDIKQGEIKHFDECYEVKANSIDKTNRTIEVVATKEVVDRHGDIVKVNGIDINYFMKNPVVPFGHNYGALPVAKAVGIRVESDELIMKLQFPTKEIYEFADTVFNMLVNGFLRAVSIGFIPVKMAWDDELHANIIEKSELLEVSIVPVPANQEALAKAYGLMAKEEEKEEEKDEEKPEEKQVKEENAEILKKYRKYQVLLRDVLSVEATEDESETVDEVMKLALSYVKTVKEALNKHLEESEKITQDSDIKSKQEVNRPVKTLAGRALKLVENI